MFRLAVGNLLSRPLRSFLALTGLAIAIGGMVALFSIADGLDYVVHRTFAQIPGLSVQQRGAPVPVFSTLPAAWEKDLQQMPGVAVVDAEIIQRLNVMDGKALISPPRFAVGFQIVARKKLEQDVYRANMQAGRYLDQQDVNQFHCLISHQISMETGKGVGDPLELNGQIFEIVGIYETGSVLLDVNILMDINTVRRLMRIAPDTVSFFYVEAAPKTDKRKLKDQIEQHFLNRSATVVGVDATSLALLKQARNWVFGPSAEPSARSFKPASQAATGRRPQSDADEKSAPSKKKTSAVEVRLAEDWAERFSDFTGDLDLFLTMITTMAVLIAVLSIVNTMTMSVAERTIEFGILRANGWSKGNIVQLMTYESGLLGLAGGSIGIFFGWLVTLIVNSIWSDRLQLHASPRLLVFALSTSLVLGILGGLYPAWTAARRSPMDAIRRG